MKTIELNKENKANIDAITQPLDKKQLREFYNCGDVFVSTSMAEGFGLPGLEAMACGKPNIQTNFGGQMEYCNSENCFLIDEGAMVKVKDDVQYEEVKWFKPSISAIRKQLRWIFEHQKQVTLMKEACLNTAKQFTWTNTGKIATKTLGELE